MNVKKIQRQYAILALSVCLLAALSLSYTVFASEKVSGEKRKEEKRVETQKEYKGLNESEVKAEEKKKKEVEEKKRKEVEEKKRKEAEEKKRKEEEKQRQEAEEKKKKQVEEKKKVENAFHIQMSEKDLTNLYRLVQSEVGFMDEKSKLLVASVVLNRVNSKKFPDTVSEVVLQKLGKVYQFSPVAPGKRFWTCTVSPETKAAVDKVLKNGDYSKGALYFVAKKYTTKGGWFDRNLHWLSHHEGQDYYRER